MAMDTHTGGVQSDDAVAFVTGPAPSIPMSGERELGELIWARELVLGLNVSVHKDEATGMLVCDTGSEGALDVHGPGHARLLAQYARTRLADWFEQIADRWERVQDMLDGNDTATVRGNGNGGNDRGVQPDTMPGNDGETPVVPVNPFTKEPMELPCTGSASVNGWVFSYACNPAGEPETFVIYQAEMPGQHGLWFSIAIDTNAKQIEARFETDTDEWLVSSRDVPDMLEQVDHARRWMADCMNIAAWTERMFPQCTVAPKPRRLPMVE